MNVKLAAPTTTCATCHGWSCQACVQAVPHDLCVLDCPECLDVRMISPEPWDRLARHADGSDDLYGGAPVSVRPLGFPRRLVGVFQAS